MKRLGQDNEGRKMWLNNCFSRKCHCDRFLFVHSKQFTSQQTYKQPELCYQFKSYLVLYLFPLAFISPSFPLQLSFRLLPEGGSAKHKGLYTYRWSRLAVVLEHKFFCLLYTLIVLIFTSEIGTQAVVQESILKQWQYYVWSASAGIETFRQLTMFCSSSALTLILMLVLQYVPRKTRLVDQYYVATGMTCQSIISWTEIESEAPNITRHC